MQTVSALVRAVRQEAERGLFPVDHDVYAKAAKDPLEPVLFAGALDAPVCFFGRDLGKNEVAVSQPLVGAGGRLIRAGVFEAIHGSPPPKTDKRVESILAHVLLCNTVPYKPPGNKAYSDEVKERFRPFVAELLSRYWSGSTVVSLGTEAFQWFAPYALPDGLASASRFWEREDRFESVLTCEIRVETGSKTYKRSVSLAPLPHPSPLNRRWLPKLPDLLQGRLRGVLRSTGGR